MQDPPPPPLVERLERLGLATVGQVRTVERRARRLAKGVPLFESVWVDALAQARLLTPFQAAELNAGRGEALRLGPYLLCQPLAGSRVARCYRARHVETGREVRLAVAATEGDQSNAALSRLEKLVAKGKSLEESSLAPVHEVGLDGARLWAACKLVEGQTAARWITHHGRFPPEVVLEIARQMLAGLVVLERAGLVHGDVGVSNLILSEQGQAVLPHPGLRPALRPEEGYAHADLPPEAFDNVAPERVRQAAPADVLGDVYACGVLWWHLLAGRSPLPAGDSLAKMRAAQAPGIRDVRRFAPQAPEALAAAVSACARRAPGERPESLARLAATLGSSTQNGRGALSQCLRQGKTRSVRWVANLRKPRRSSRIPRGLRVAAGSLVVLALMIWWLAHLGPPAPSPPVSPAASLGKETSALPVETPLPAPEKLPPAPADLAAEKPLPRGPRGSSEVILSVEGPVDARALRLAPGRHVRGPSGKRPLVAVPREGLRIDVEDVHFEGIDFLWQASETPGSERSAIIQLRASGATFEGCRFRAIAGLAPSPVAVRWTYPAKRADAELTLPNGRIRLNNCVLREVETAVDCRTAGALALEFSNVLHLGVGPLVRLDHAPRPDEPVRIRLRRTTLRRSGPLLACRHERLEGSAGPLAIETVACALLPEGQTALLLFEGPDSPEAILQDLRWSGQGTLVGAEAPIAAWRREERTEVLDDATVSIAGVVRSKVTFAGEATGPAGASRILDWQAPLRSTEPPGVDPSKLPKPAVAPDAEGSKASSF